jgi:dihydrofolate synthase/folylpolyglutamate synthase
LIEPTERIRICGRDITKADFVTAYEIVAKKTSDLKLSHFEMLTLMAMQAFHSDSEGPLDWIILEVGLGGTWDATNAVDHETSVITALGMDHENLLGSTLTEIAKNKFGIITQNTKRVIHAPFPKEVLPLKQASWKEAPSFDLSTQFREKEQEPVFMLHSKWGTAQLALPGRRGAENSVLAMSVFESLGFNPSEHLQALVLTRWPGRMERLPTSEGRARIYLSGDHNPHGVQSLLKLLDAYSRKHLHILVGVGRDKDCDGILEPLFQLKDASIYLTETPFRGRSLNDYGKWLRLAQGAWEDPREAYCRVLERAKSDEMVLVTGSLYLVGLVKSL